ncbi:hypothetical protein BC826DRAFT_976530 [Russula brevipes]|nr:hypothetical protein BC826DRAFT_976530 [Russula brevipes]
MSTPSPIYELSEADKQSSASVDQWVESLECQMGNGPAGLLARIDAAWTAVAQSRHLWQRDALQIRSWGRDLGQALTRIPNRSDAVFTDESWHVQLENNPSPLFPVPFDVMAPTGPWQWWADGSELYAPQSQSVSGPMQDRDPIRTDNVTQTAHGTPDIHPSSDDGQDEPESKPQSNREIPAQTPGPVRKKGKGKAANKDVTGQGAKPMSCWMAPRKANIDFNLDIDALIEDLKPGELLTPDEVYSAPEWHGVPRTHPRREPPCLQCKSKGKPCITRSKRVCLPCYGSRANESCKGDPGLHPAGTSIPSLKVREAFFEDLLKAKLLPFGENAVLHAPAYDAAVLGEVKSAYVNALTKFGPRKATRKGEDEDDREPRRGRKTVRDVQKSSGPRSLSRKAASDGLWYSLRTFVLCYG